MPKNRFKLRNFDSHHDGGMKIPSVELSLDESDRLYEQNRGLTHAFVHTNRGSDDDVVRLISDVEIIHGSDLSVKSMFPPEYRQRLRSALLSQSYRTPVASMPDDLLAKLCVPSGLELDERVSYITSRLDFYNDTALSALSSYMTSSVDSSTEIPSTDD